MLEVAAHSRRGLVDSRAPVIAAENSLTHGGTGLRLLVLVMAGRLPSDLDPYLGQQYPAADLIGQSTVVVSVIRELAESFAGATAVREHDPVTLEVFGYEVDGAPEALVLAHPLREITGPPARVRLLASDVPAAPYARTSSR